MSKEIYKACKKLYKELYKIEDFKNLFSKGDLVEYIVENDDYYPLVKGSIVKLSNIFNYDLDGYFLGVFDTNTLLDYIKPSEGYPFYNKVLIKDGEENKWRVGKPSNFFVSTLKSVNSLLNPGDLRPLNWLHMEDENLVLSILHPKYPIKNYIYKKNYKSAELDGLFENLIDISNRFSFDVKEIFWFTEGSYTKIKAFRHLDGESTLVIS